MLELFNISRVSYEENMIGTHARGQFLVVIILTEHVLSETNVAIGRPATQSSTLNNNVSGLCVAGRAVDGNYDPEMYHGSCAHTADLAGGPNWWRVDLGQPMHIRMVTITNRNTDANRLDLFIVGITNNADDPVRGCYALCGQYPSAAVISAKHYLHCNPIAASGRYVIVQQPTKGVGYLSLCEVEVFAGQVRNTAKWRQNMDQRLMTNGTVVQKKRSALECIGYCKYVSGCDSVNYRSMEQICEMNFLPRGVKQCDLVNATGWSWWTQVYEFV